jgi:hypothetical protein
MYLFEELMKKMSIPAKEAVIAILYIQLIRWNGLLQDEQQRFEFPYFTHRFL